ncbi:MAG: heparinase II/III family protein [Roseiarcus sp.]|jgi:ubiquinone/menaquinone biosynthesis C-methylase UbiE
MSAVSLETGDAYKDEVQRQWDRDPCGSHYVRAAAPDTLEWFLEIERYRYEVYAPWMAGVMEFAAHAGERILEIGAGVGTDHAQFARHGGVMHDLDLSAGHLKLAERNFQLRGLESTFRQGDVENIPYADESFDLVYSNGVIHHTPNAARAVREIHRVLKPGGRCIIMVYAENSLHYWRNLFAELGVVRGELEVASMGDIMSRHAELSEHGSRPLVKVYTARRLRRLFGAFEQIRICKRQMIRAELPRGLGWLPLDLAGRLMGWNLIVKARKAPSRASVGSPAPGAGGFATALATAGIDFPTWLARRRAGPRHYVEAAPAHLETLRRMQPAAVAAARAAAEVLITHGFDLLGSGPYVPDDPDRPARAGYRPIDWRLDPVRGLRFPAGVPHKEWRLYEMRPGDADIKYPWELARCQHWMTLAQAWRLSREARFAREIADQLDDFLEANPVGLGINWTCAMDVAIRAANWCLALALVLDCADLDEDFWRRAHGALYDHADFIFANLEDKYEVTSNHYLSNVVGLHFLAAEFADLAVGRSWDRWARAALDVEIGVQVHEEGTDFESSVPYHRLVTELFLASARLAQFQGRPLDSAVTVRLGRMVDFSLAIARPDGRMPVIGDADDGRFHIFSHLGGWDRQDARHLLAPAAFVLDRPRLLAFAGPLAPWEAAWWGFDPAGAARPAAPPPDVAELYPAFGVAVARRGGNYLAVTNGAVGTRGFGNHKHNELLGFEYHHAGAPIVVDPGSFVYTSDFAARNLFRGTAYHSTLMIDGVEQNELNPEWIFRLFESADPEHLLFGREGDRAHYHGRHKGYARLPQPVIHEREFRFDLADGRLEIDDRLLGEGAHDLQWRFHLAPGIEAVPEEPGRVRLTAGDRRTFTLTHDPRLEASVADAWNSPSYGVRSLAKAIGLSRRVALNGELTVRFVIGEAGPG